MSLPYVAGVQSKEYYQLPKPQKIEVDQETNRRFREKTGVTRRLDPTNGKDLELRRTWLRIRDEVITDRDAQELRHELDLDGLTAIPEEMRFEGWNEGAQLMETWFERPPTVTPNYTAPVTDLIKMSWVLRFGRAKSVYDAIFKDRVWTNDPSRKRIREILKGKALPSPGQSLPFGNLSAPVTVVDEQWVNARPVQNGFSIDALTAALGRFVFNIAISGTISRIGPNLPGVPALPAVMISIDEVGVYVKDSFDFEGDQFLGWWGYRDTDYYNSDFREWRLLNHAGGDFRVYSDVKRTKLAISDILTIPIP
ncbi:hypothetical protein H7849_22390 [Alloacidobacterium dinghuense]|uniref:Uncharacterized protein n=1 Tax=Alloacidobacterium dinghuense TaxID=2763107 RepID=A0A7G8BGU3_9BACT|nr:DUF6402 family protein [Alloacidobacterium dinghuense]QNI31763.1 hypothetical protein H7849_22390 [Alloacidobacterium dinghuense]